MSEREQITAVARALDAAQLLGWAATLEPDGDSLRVRMTKRIDDHTERVFRLAIHRDVGWAAMCSIPAMVRMALEDDIRRRQEEDDIRRRQEEDEQ